MLNSSSVILDRLAESQVRIQDPGLDSGFHPSLHLIGNRKLFSPDIDSATEDCRKSGMTESDR